MHKQHIFPLGAFIFLAMVAIGHADMVALTDSEMNRITGRSGLRLLSEEVNLILDVDTLYYKDDDGVGAFKKPGYLSFNNLSVRGRLAWNPPPIMGLETIQAGTGILGLTDFNYTIKNLVMEIDSFEIDAIRVGASPGTGLSFGSIGLYNMTLHMEGEIRISTHP